MKYFGNKGKAVLGAVGAGLVTAGAMATPPVLGPISFPVDVDSIAEEIAVAGGTILLAVFTLGIGFFLVKRGYRWMRGSTV